MLFFAISCDHDGYEKEVLQRLGTAFQSQGRPRLDLAHSQTQVREKCLVVFQQLGAPLQQDFQPRCLDLVQPFAVHATQVH
jgi:hypothetical protein